MRVKVQSIESDWSRTLKLPDQPKGLHPSVRYDRIQDAVMDALNELPVELRPTEAFTWAEVIEVPEWWFGS